ncbi:VgrG-related protein [Kitasatospora sp. NPDC091257]|uniref:VgrG-related protein n=1 Tax=unclassified Kitasatospora TaxID=2633591 RepID=UPI002F91AEF4
MTTYSATPLVETTAALPEEWAARLTTVDVDTRANLPALATLRFRDPNHQLLSSSGIAIGTPLKVSADTTADSRPVVLFSGEVAGVASEVEEQGTFTVLRAYDRAQRLTRGRRLTAWQETTLEKVVRDIASHAALGVGSVAGSTSKIKYLVQPNITDWEFLQYLAELHGAVVVVNNGTLFLKALQSADSAPDPRQAGDDNPYVLSYGTNLLSLQVAVGSPGPAGEVQVRGWNIDTKKATVGTAKVDGSKYIDIGTRAGYLATKLGGGAFTEVIGTGYALQGDVKGVAEYFADTAAAAIVDLEATVYGSPHLTAGTPVTLVNVGEPFTGRYTVTGTRHVFDRGYRTKVNVSSQQRVPHAARNGPAAYAVPGLAIGTVQDVRDPDTRQSGAVRIAFPWLSEDYVSDWARTVQFGGEGGGGVISPGIGDEVLVGFEQGRLDRPYVLGGLYNGKDHPSTHSVDLIDADSKAVNRRSLSSREGNRIELLDHPDEGGVLLSTGDQEVKIRLDRKAKKITIEAENLELKGTKSLTLTTDSLEIGDNTKSSLKLNAKTVEINGTDSVKIASPKVDVG